MFRRTLDDWVIRHLDRSILEDHLLILVRICLKLGLLVNWTKSDLVPSRDFLFVGYRFRTDLGLALPSEERVLKIQSLIAPFTSCRALPASRMLSLLGLLSATEKLVPLGRLHMRELQHDLRSQWTQPQDPDFSLVSLSARSLEDLFWWADRVNLLRGSPLHQPVPNCHIFTDASM